MSNLRFASPEHRDFFLDMMSEARRNDCYHRAFFYVMGIAPETRANIRQMFDFKQDCIEPDGMHGGWQTSGTVRVCRLAVCRKPLARRVVPKKACADDEDRKTPFVVK